MSDNPILLQDLLSLTRQRLDKAALICQKIEYKYSDIDDMSTRFSSFLYEQGIRSQDRILICAGNSIDTVVAFWGALKANAVVSIISPGHAHRHLKDVLKDLEPQFLIYKKPINHTISFSFEYQCKLILADIGEKKTLLKENDFSMQSVIQSSSLHLPPRLSINADLAMIIYTSGSTGVPKGIMLSHHNMMSATQSLNHYLINSSADRFINVLPLSFDYGLYQMIMAFSVGATLILEEGFLWPAHILRQIEKYKITALPGVPTLFRLLKKNMEQSHYDVTSLRLLTNTGATLSISDIHGLQQCFPHVLIYSMYGLTECKRCTYLPPNEIAVKPTSIGLPIPNTKMWVVDDDNQSLPPYKIGQFVVKGSTVMRGYWRKPEETAKKLRYDANCVDTVLYTGDYGYQDKEGYFYFCGRADEVIKCRGMKVSLKEIEETALISSDISESACVVIEKEEAVIYLFVSSDSPEKTVRLSLQALFKSKLESFKYPTRISILKELPKTVNGKIDKQYLSKIARAEDVSYAAISNK